MCISVPCGPFLAIVDEADADLVAPFVWRPSVRPGKTVYALTSGQWPNRVSILMHRLILGLEPHGPKVDHRDRDGLNNRRSNLRLATSQQNGANRRGNIGASSKYKGVYRYRTGWRAYIWIDGKTRHLGCFADEDDAARAYDKAALDAWGEFALPNLLTEGAA